MAISRPSFDLGIEEEYFLVDRDTRNVVAEPPASVLAESRRLLHDHVVAEFMESQIEVSTGVCTNLAEARADLAHLRRTVSQVARAHGLAVVASSTHPFADWGAQRRTHLDWSDALARNMQRVARRLLVCAMHIHVGIEDEGGEVRLGTAVRRILLLARMHVATPPPTTAAADPLREIGAQPKRRRTLRVSMNRS